MKVLKRVMTVFFLGFFSHAALSADIVDTASENEQFSTLVTAVVEAGLVDTLKSDGPFTVFAPTNEAFAKLPEGALEALLADKEALQNVLLYHVVAGAVNSSTAATLSEASMANGDQIKIKKACDSLLINGAKVVKADIEASNGIIHVIDSVLLPPSLLAE